MMARLRVSRWRVWWPVLPFVAAALAFGLWPANSPQTAGTHEFTLDMTRYAFTPGRVTVAQGDTVTLTLTASDVVHGFYLDGYGLQQRVEPGISQQVTFVAEEAGKFRFRCSVSCGPMHPFMIGELVVTPNRPFWRAAGAAVSAFAGALVFVWQTGRDRKELA
ncbi:MAG: hypothetical protein Kow0077_29250 [Anaerolineae bacterium]